MYIQIDRGIFAEEDLGTKGLEGFSTGFVTGETFRNTLLLRGILTKKEFPYGNSRDKYAERLPYGSFLGYNGAYQHFTVQFRAPCLWKPHIKDCGMFALRPSGFLPRQDFQCFRRDLSRGAVFRV